MQKDFWETYRDKGLLVVGINLGEKPEKVKAYQKKYGLSFPVLMDPDKNTVSRKRVSVPYNLLVDDHGVIRYAEIGFAPQPLNSAIVKLLSAP